LSDRKLRITVNTDPLVSPKDRQSEIFLRDFIRPFPNLTRLEIDYTMLKLNDPRIQRQLLALPNPEHSDFDGRNDIPEISSVEEPRTESRTGDCNAEQSLGEEAGVVVSGTASTVVSFQLKVSAPRHRRSKKLPYHGFGSWHLKQHSLLFEQVHLTNLRHVHLTYDFENLTNSDGSITRYMLGDVGMQVWPHLKTLKICITYEVDSRSVDFIEQGAVSGCLMFFACTEADTSLDQESLLWDWVYPFDETRWHGPDITLLVSIRDAFTPERGSFHPGSTAGSHAARALNACRNALPPLKAFQPNARTEYSATIPPDLNLEIHAYALSPYLDGSVPLLVI
jgi:hypothetical protein